MVFFFFGIFGQRFFQPFFFGPGEFFFFFVVVCLCVFFGWLKNTKTTRFFGFQTYFYFYRYILGGNDPI